MTGPSHAYYRSMHGRWRCSFGLTITDWPAFWASPMGWFDRLQVLSLVLLPKVVGPPALETTVDYDAKGERGEVLHTTRLAKWGMTLFRSIEVMSLDDDGRRATMRGDQWVSPIWWRSRDSGEGRVEIDETAKRARYTFPWVGTEMRQNTEVVPGGLRLTQETDWSHSEQILRRR